MSSKADRVRAAAAQLEAALNGESRLDQYVVEKADKIVEEVSEEEYRRIIEKRREDFVVDDKGLGYEDMGKELWDGDEAAKEQRLAATAGQAKAKAAPAKASAGAKAASSSSPHKPGAAPAGASLQKMFQAGARSSGASEHGATTAAAGGSAKDSHRQKELDDMLNQMCGELDLGAGGTEAPAAGAPAAAPGGKKASKRKATATEGGARAGKKAAGARKGAGAGAGEGDGGAAAAAVAEEGRVKRELEEEDKDKLDALAKVKLEPSDEADAVVKHEAQQKGKRAKREVKAEPVDAVSVKREVKAEPGDGSVIKMEPAEPAEASGAAQMRAWLQGGSCQGVTVDVTAAAEETVPSTGSQMQLSLEEDGACWFFFADAFEDDRASPPRLYLFGKVRTAEPGAKAVRHESCCLVVERVERCIHLLLNVNDLNDDEHIKEVARRAEAEFDGICRQQFPGVRKLRAKLKYRNYAFEKANPYGNGELPFLKVVLDAAGQMPPAGMYGETFSMTFGAQTSMLERVLTRQRIMGPSWLRLQPNSWREDPARLSYCAVELRVTPSSVSVAKTDDERRQLTAMGMPTASPPLRMLSVSMQTVQRSAQQPHEPVAISCTLHPRLNPDAPESDRDLRDGMQQWAAIRRIDTQPLPRDSEIVLGKAGVEHYTSEVALLNALLTQIHEFDPDVIAGHNAYGFDLDVLASRMYHLRLQGWQKLGRLRRSKDRIPHVEGGRGGGFWVGNSITAGRLVCDVMLQAKDLLPKIGTYDLANLAREHLGLANLQTVEPENLHKYYDTAHSVKDLAEVTFYHALCVARLTHSLQILPLTKQLTNLAGNLWNMSLQNKRAERNEMLLCHEFHRRKFVLPDRENAAAKKRRLQAEGPAMGFDDAEDQENAPAAAGPRRGKAAYSGGLVLEPKVGLYDEFVMMLDFNSLYPSIIQEHNICFTTVERPNELQVAACGTEAELLAKTGQPDGTLSEGVLPQVLRRLVESRRSVKAAMKSERDARRRQMLEIRQLALKLTANSMYGCLGFQNSRFYAKPLAALITARGRDALQSTITVVQNELQLEVVYGDTDSVFVNTKTQDYTQAMQAAQQIKTNVNKRYKKLEIEIDAVFGRLMLLKKKKYAALKVVDWEKKQFAHELKGLDIVRRDWCHLAKDIGHQILMRVLGGEGKEEAVNWTHSFLQEQAKEMDESRVPLQRYVITKGLTKDPKDYPDAKNQPHVQVALRLQARGKAVRAGQEIEYVVVEAAGGAEAGSKALLADRARHPHEFQLDPTLRVDVAWYKKQQVHPLVSRLLAPVEGTDAARLAECLGLDGSRFAQAAAAQAAAEAGEDTAYVRTAMADVNALFDRKVRWKDFNGSLPGVKCLKCQEITTWKQLLQPDVWKANGVSAMFCCSKCPEQIKPKRAQNLFVIQLRHLLKEHCEGWVQCPGDECIEKTRRLSCGQNMVNSRMVLRELEYMEYLCESEALLPGADHRGCRAAVEGMKRTVQWLLDTNGFNWVDCGQVFGGIFGGGK